MPACPVCQKGKPEILCLGCGKKICAGCVIEVRGVKYCKNCQTVAQELEKTLSSPSYTPAEGASNQKISKYSIHDSSEDAKWEKTFDGSAMVEVAPAALREVRQLLDLRGCYAGMGRRVAGHVLDWAFAGLAGLLAAWVTTFFPASYVYILAEEFDKSFVLLPLTVLWSAVALLVLRVILNAFGGVTLGRLFAGTKLVAADGTPAGFGRGLLHAIAATLLDALAVVGWVLYLVFFNKQGQSLHDRIAGTCVVNGSEYKKAAVNAIMAKSKQKLGVAPAPARKSRPGAPAAEAAATGAAGAAGVAAAGAVPPALTDEELFGNDELQSPFATYDEFITESPPEDEEGGDGGRESDEDRDDGDEDRYRGSGTDIGDPWNT